MNTLGKVLIAAVLAAPICSAMAGTAVGNGAAANPPVHSIGQIIYEGGDGTSIENAVFIKNAKSEFEGVKAESEWIARVHPGWKKGMQALLVVKGRPYDRIEYTTSKGEIRIIYFDIADFFGKF